MKGKVKSILCRTAPDESLAYEWLYDAMLHYERAEAVRPPGNDDAHPVLEHLCTPHHPLSFVAKGMNLMVEPQLE